MPEKRVTNVVEVVDFIAIVSILKSLLLRSFYDFCGKDSPLKVDCIGHIYLAVVDEVMSSFEIFNGLLE